MSLSSIQQRFGRCDLAIDLGTAQTRLHATSRSTSLARPSVVWHSGHERAALKSGVIVDADAATEVLTDLLQQLGTSRWQRSRAIACVPSDTTEDERGLVAEAVLRAGARGVTIVDEPLAASIGAGLARPDAERVEALVDVGEGVTDCAVIVEGRIERSSALRVAVSDLRQALLEWIQLQVDVRVSPREAERLLREVGVARGRQTPRSVHLVGSPGRGIGPVQARVDTGLLHTALAPVVDRITGHVATFVEGLPSELAGLVVESGVCLTGGGALLHGFTDRFVSELGMGVSRPPDPLNAVVDGARVLAGARFGPRRQTSSAPR